jgi:Haem-degrading
VPVLKFGTGAKASAVEMQVAVIHGHRVPPVGLFGTYRLPYALALLCRDHLRTEEHVAAPRSSCLLRVRTKPPARVLALSGGLPIKVGDDVVGTVGVSGSPGNDDDCSQAGIDKVAAQLK